MTNTQISKKCEFEVTFLPTKPTTCPEIIINHEGIAENIIFESYRDELLAPQEIEL
ncbi:hypothetical protein MEO94_27455 [Dolichospermum sp. ST_sed9]|jgi:hypothetical protein|nr:hypothetical protein [Dolichospermum sp. ST_sed9]